MSRRIPLLFTVLSTLAMACAPQEAQDAVPAEEMAAVDLATELAALKEADALYSQVASARDIEGFVAMYAPDAVVYPPEAPALTGLDAIREMIREFAADPAAGGTFEFVTAQVSADADMGYTLNMARITGTDPGTGEAVTGQIRDFHVWRKQPDGSWKIVIDIWNPEPPAGATN